MRRSIIILSLLTALLIPATGLVAQEQGELLCASCKQPNNPDNNYCTSCGVQLAEQKAELHQTKPFTFREPSRLFSVPNATVIPELAIGFTLGNSFGQQEAQSFLGNVSVGIGDVAEIELNAGGLVGNIIAGTTRMSTWAFKVQVFSGSEVWPMVALSLRSSNDWDEAQFDGRTLQTNAEELYTAGLRWLDYRMRLTTATVSLTHRISPPISGSVSLGFSDIRRKNMYTQWASAPERFDPDVRRHSQFQYSAGIAYTLNPRTNVIVEAQTIPFFDVNVAHRELVLKRMYVGAAGIRFALSRAFTLDSGIRYQSNFIGLADTQVRVALNGIFMIPM